MKKLSCHRRDILRAIRLACMVIFLAAGSRKVHAQQLTAPFTHVSGNTYTTTTPYAGTGTFYGPYGVCAVTVNPGTAITNTTASHGDGSQYNDAATDIATGGGAFSNNGSITLSITAPTTHYYSAVALYGSEGGTDTTLTNSGTINSSASTTGGAASTISAAGVSYDNSDGLSDAPDPSVGDFSITVNNTGTISGTASGYAFGLHLADAGSGNQTIVNSSGASITATSSSNYATGIYAYATGASTGNISFQNGGTLSATANTPGVSATAIDARTTSGTITVSAASSGTGTISAYAGGVATGISAVSQSGTISITSPSTITVSATQDAYGVNASTSGGAGDSLMINLSGTQTVTSSAAAATGIEATAQSANVSVTEGGALTVNGPQNLAVGIDATSSTGTVDVTVNNTLLVNSSTAGNGEGIVTSGAGVTVGLNAAETVSANSSAVGIRAIDNSSGTIIVNMGTGSSLSVTSQNADANGIEAMGANAVGVTITHNGTLSASGFYLGDYGIEAQSATGAITITGNGAGTISASSAGTSAEGIYSTTSSGTITINQQATIGATTSAGGADGIAAISSSNSVGAGAIMVTDSGAISASGTYEADGIRAIGNGAGVTVNATGSTIDATSAGNSYYAYGINAASQQGTVIVTNSAAITATASSGYGVGISAGTSGAGNASLTNSGNVTVNSSSSNGLSAYNNGSGTATIINNAGTTLSVTGGSMGPTAGIDAVGNSGLITVTNNGTVNASGSGYDVYGCRFLGNGGGILTNTGAITATGLGSGSAYGAEISLSGDITVNNSASGSLVSTATSDAGGLFVTTDGTAGSTTTNGTILVTNSGRISASSSGFYSIGIFAASENGAAGGPVTIINHGVVSGSGAKGGYGIYASSGASLVTVTTTGEVDCISGSGYMGYGVYATSAGSITITNIGGSANTFSSSYGSGKIIASAAVNSSNAGGTGIYLDAGASGTVGNTGMISSNATGTGGSFGVDATTSGDLTITNDQTGSISSVAVDGNAVAIYGSDQIAGQDSIVNMGSLTATSGSGYTGGIVIHSAGSSSSTNSGSITSQHTGAGTEGAYGIYSDVSGISTVINSGTITTSGSGYDGAYGVNSRGAAASIVTNSGTITTSGSGYDGSYGIYSRAGTSTVTNSGTLSAVSTGSGYGAFGIDSTSLTGASSVTNSGTMNVTSSDAGASGIYLDAAATGTVGNTGMISSNATGTGGSFGVDATTSGDLTITNDQTGSISSVAVDGNAVAIYGSDQIAGQDSIVNMGSLTATSGSGYTGGIVIHSAGSSSSTNSGSITSQHTGAGTEGAYGIYSDVSGTSTVINSGTITTSGSGYDGSYGIYSRAGTSTVTNSGTLSAVSTGSGYGAFGIDSTSLTGASSVTNTSLLTATGSAYSDGLYIRGATAATATNSGTMNVTSSDSFARGMDIASTAGDATVTNIGTLTVHAHGEADGVYLMVGTSGDGVVTNSGAITALSTTGEAFGIQDLVTDGSASVSNSGTITVTTQAAVEATGVYIEPPGPISMTNSNAIAVTGMGEVEGVYLVGDGGTADFTNTATGSITATGAAADTYGVRITDSAAAGGTIENDGTITSSGLGLADNSAGDITVNNMRGSIQAGSGFRSILLGAGNNTVNIIGNSNIQGLMDGGSTHTDNTIAFSDIVITRPQQTAFNTVSSEAATDPTGNYVVMLGPDSYNFTDFNFVTANVIVSTFSGQVDSGLENLAERLDNLANVPNGILPVYLAGASNPEAALNSFTGREFLNAYATIGLGDDATFNELTDNRDFDIRAGTGGLDLSGLEVTSDSLIASLGDTESTLNDLSETRIGGTEVLSDSPATSQINPSKRWGAWVSGTVTKADESTRYDSPGYQATTGSPTLGVDYRLADDLAVGGLLHLWTTGANFGDGSRLGVETVFIGGYGTYSHDHWYANALVGAGYSNYDNDRQTLSGATAYSSPSGNKILATVSGGYDFVEGPWRISPVAGLQYDHTGIDSYSESGAGALDLNIADENIDSLRSKLGFRIMRNFQWMGWTFTPDVRASWYHEFLNQTRGVTESSAGSPALGEFVVDTVKPDDDFAMAGVGISATPAAFDRNVTFFTTYNTQAGSHYVSQTVSGGLRIGF